jgi:hypothetical protein
LDPVADFPAAVLDGARRSPRDWLASPWAGKESPRSSAELGTYREVARALVERGELSGHEVAEIVQRAEVRDAAGSGAVA